MTQTKSLPVSSATGEDSTTPSKFHAILAHQRTGWRRYSWILWALLGPGMLAMIGDNDAGGVIEYAVTGIQFGIGLFIPLILCLAPLTFTIQEMTMRLSAVTQIGFTKLVFRHFGRFFGYYSLATLMIENLLTLMTEFIGMTAGLMMMGLPLWGSDLLSLLLVVSLAIFTGYWTKERLALFVSALNAVFILVAFLTHPSLSAVAHAFTAWSIPHHLQGSVIWFVVATVGNAIAPWMIFFQGSAAIDKGITAKELRLGRIDTLIGSLVQVFIAVAIVLCGAVLYGHIQNVASVGPTAIIHALSSNVGRTAGILFGFGLFNAGFLASITISLSSSWTVADAFGFARSLNDKISTAPKFYAVYIGSLVAAAAAILVPGLPLNFIAVLSQALGAMVMIPILLFLVILTSNREIMGNYANGGFQRVWGFTIALVLISLTVTLVIQTL
ncbi:NRAMP family divalent metal transporter [Sulfoacidibacillus thermotolerans]|uniref:Metal transporter n=1 Tax=Sulfoacidibacillus thermotolerans TaxID=1765684 RepID=A0A2U3DBV9_SULT2|nr:divalent metal cation transporter [Sulfoacidibacillus thermotolerans]PWI58742.1 hypothetical protein BM613_01200 [Sulfoacidibacillus thermotolerans]